MKYILVTGGVISGIGKGVIASSIGTLLKACSVHVTSIKIDPYINIDAGTFSPYEHGEVFVLDDGGEVDLDLGNYERFLDVTLHRDNNITTGKIYQHVIQKERRGDYLGKTVQVVPHITDAIKEWVKRVAHMKVDDDHTPEVCVIELGGTIGDIEGMPFVEAFRQFQFEVGRENFCNIHVSLVPEPKSTGEQKTKPTQQSVQHLRAAGLSPDVIVCRSDHPIQESVKQKISLFCHVAPKNVICIHDSESIYQVPLDLEKQGIIEYFRENLHINAIVPVDRPLMPKWEELADKMVHLRKHVTIALVGKYTQLKDSYASVVKSLQHAALACDRKLNINYIEAEALEPPKDSDEQQEAKYHSAWKSVCESDGILVPGGFGSRGVEGKIAAIKKARISNKPFLGICFGLQCAVIEYARNVCGIKGANSTEVEPDIDEESKLVIDMPEHHPGDMGGTMRLGRRETHFMQTASQSTLKLLYGGCDVINERHRHRYEVNPDKVELLEKHGLLFTGKDDTGKRMEIVELPRDKHKFYAAVQFHPEYLSRPLKPSPPYLGFILASCGKLDDYLARLNKKKVHCNGTIPTPLESGDESVNCKM